jgi:hypothetical protein
MAKRHLGRSLPWRPDAASHVTALTALTAARRRIAGILGADADVEQARRRVQSRLSHWSVAIPAACNPHSTISAPLYYSALTVAGVCDFRRECGCAPANKLTYLTSGVCFRKARKQMPFVASSLALPADGEEINCLDVQRPMLRFAFQGNYAAPSTQPASILASILDVGASAGRWRWRRPFQMRM